MNTYKLHIHHTQQHVIVINDICIFDFLEWKITVLLQKKKTFSLLHVTTLSLFPAARMK